MCAEHWRAYVKGLREARKAGQATNKGPMTEGGEEVEAA